MALTAGPKLAHNLVNGRGQARLSTGGKCCLELFRHQMVTAESPLANWFSTEEVLMMPKKQNDPRLARLRQLFTARHPEGATEDDVFLFFRWLQLCHPEMLPKGKHDDSYQDLTADLHGLYHD